MSIVALLRVTLAGATSVKAALIAQLQDFGALHIDGVPSAEPRAALAGPRQVIRFLAAARGARRGARAAREIDPRALQERARAIAARLATIAEERAALARRIAILEAWGDFELPREGALGGLRLWFYCVPHYRLARLPKAGTPWQVVHRDDRFCYVAAAAAQEPNDIGEPRAHIGALSLGELRERSDTLDDEADDLEAERARLARSIGALEAHVARLEDHAARERALAALGGTADVFVLQGWIPAAQAAALARIAARFDCALILAEPKRVDAPPTLLANRPSSAGGEDLVAIYTTPAYGGWDPSSAVLYGFAIFFGLMSADAGYALVLATITALLWRRLGTSRTGTRLRGVLVLATAATAVAGVLVGSYFGAAPAVGSALDRVRLVDLDDTVAMMEVAGAIGLVHLVAGNAAAARAASGAARFAPIGWIVAFAGGGLCYLAYTRTWPAAMTAGVALALAGLALVAAFSGSGRTMRARVAEGCVALARVPGALGDVLSYLRLFALGFAGATLAGAVNGLANDVWEGPVGLGVLAAPLILVLGHALNFVLTVGGALVHGLRLNFIEFFNWAGVGEGRPFQPLERKERRSSTR